MKERVGRRAGASLLMAVALLTALTFVAALLIAPSRSASELAIVTKNRILADAHIDGLFEKTLFRILRKDREALKALMYGTALIEDDDGALARVTIAAPVGLIDLNKAPPKLLKALLHATLGDRQSAETAADSIFSREWTSDRLQFRTPAQLEKINGMSTESYRKLRRHVTVQGGTLINPLFASATVLQSIPEFTQGDAERIAASKTLTGGDPSEIAKHLIESAPQAAREFLSPNAPDLITIRIEFKGDALASVERTYAVSPWTADHESLPSLTGQSRWLRFTVANKGDE